MHRASACLPPARLRQGNAPCPPPPRKKPTLQYFTCAFIVTALGLGVGAMYVRSITIMLVEKGTLVQYRYVEHGAVYAILILSVIMFTQTLFHIPEVITGLGAAALIGLSLGSSNRWNGDNPALETDPR